MTATLLPPPVVVEADERAARADLRAQIARLEARGARAPGLARGPRVLGLGELEALRDALLVQRPATAEASEARARARLEAMFADPVTHRRKTVSLAELGRPGCGSYYVGPRLGLVGMLAGWWEVKLSSGCP
jgi:hypothetical protein